MKTASAYILYQPLSVSLFMDEVGGSTTQRKNNVNGEFDPDRTLFPLVLRPRLIIKDPDHLLQDGDQTSGLIDTRWYIGSNESGPRITKDTSGFTLGAYGELSVKRNVEPSTPLNLYFTCAFIDARTQKTFRKTYLVTLTTAQSTELNLSIEIDAARKMPVNPFKSQARRTLTATFRNGQETIADSKAVYLWKVRDSTTRQLRAITADDLFYVSGQGTKSLVIDRRFVDKELVQVEACHTSDPTRKVYAQTKMFRWYGQWDEREVITRGKFIRPDTNEIEVRTYVDTPKGQVSTPENYFDITHIFTTNEKGALEKVIGYGESVVVPASIAGKDPNVIPVFGTEVKERTALRACLVSGKKALINGKIMCIQIPKEK
jgi:putative uncharacterized protein (fragment)